MATLHYMLHYAVLYFAVLLLYFVWVVFLFTLQMGIHFWFAITDYCAIAQSQANMGNHDLDTLQETSFFLCLFFSSDNMKAVFNKII